ncbi:MAG: hypothetical protein ABIE68_02435 [bacterium]
MTIEFIESADGIVARIPTGTKPFEVLTKKEEASRLAKELENDPEFEKVIQAIISNGGPVNGDLTKLVLRVIARQKVLGVLSLGPPRRILPR